MGSEFYAAGGWGMHPVSIFGFLLIVVSVFYAIRQDEKHGRLAFVLGAITFSAGWLGTATGISASAHYIQNVEPQKQLQTFVLGIDESLHNIILALIFVVVAGLIASVGVLRQARTKAA